MDIVRDAQLAHNFTTSTPAVHFDPHSEEFHKDPYSIYKMLRNIAPITYWGSGKAWLVTNYSGVVSILKDNRFSTNPSAWSGYEKSVATENVLVSAAKQKLLAIGDVDRQQFLRSTMPILSTQNRNMLEIIAGAATEVTQRINGRPGFDLVADFSHPLSIKIITRLLGIPEKYVAIVIRFVRACIDILDPAAIYSTTEIHHRILRINTGLDLIERTIAERRKLKGGNLLVDDLINAQPNGGSISNVDITSLISLLIFSGLDCMSLLITNSIYSILSHSKSYQMLRENSSLWPGAIKEAIRYDYFIKLGTPRYALEDCFCNNQLISKGERVYPIIAAAQRDPMAFEHPDELDIMRSPEKFIGFGLGTYACIGQSIAMLAAEVSARKLIESVYPLAVCSEPLYDQNHKTFRMITSLKLMADAAEPCFVN